MLEPQHIVALVFFTGAFEVVTIVLRCHFCLESEKIQRQLGIPRVHHAFPGFLLMGGSAYSEHMPWLFVIGGALVLSDVIHHLIAIPYIERNVRRDEHQQI